jgi:hypothetical protein
LRMRWLPHVLTPLRGGLVGGAHPTGTEGKSYRLGGPVSRKKLGLLKRSLRGE